MMANSDHDISSTINADRTFVEPTTRSSGFMKTVFVFLFCLAFITLGWLIWVIFDEGINSGSSKKIPVIKANTKPIKNRPDEPGGLLIRHRDKSVFSHLSSGEEDEPIERLLPPPEEPLPLLFPEKNNILTNDKTSKSNVFSPKVIAENKKNNQINGIWKVQLVSLKSLKSAENAISKMLELNKDILGGLELELETVELPAGLYYRVQAGPLYSRSSANTLCDKLRIKNQDCLIVAPW